MAYDAKLKEEEIKNKVAADWFPGYDCTRILGNVDFCVQPKEEGPTLWETESLLWAEAKTGIHRDFAPLFAQLVLTIGSEKTYERHSPPPFLGAFDTRQIAFLPWHAVLDLFFRSDIDWTATPSNTDTPAFRHVLGLVRPILATHLVAFPYGDPDLARFVRLNLRAGTNDTNRLHVTRNNFPFVYQKWVRDVKPSIAVDWTLAARQGIHDADFFLADLLSKDNATLMQKLFVVLRGNHYLADRQLDPSGFLDAKRADFNDGQQAHTHFWNRYRRPPRREFWDFINERRDLLMPPDIRERQGSFFTPQIWVEKAQEAIAAVLGENWQDDHYVWDCAGGTGNLLAGLDPKAKYRVWLSTLQKGDVDIVRERIANGAALLESHVFPFDFLNDPFEKLPTGLREIISDPAKRRKLVVFINPPYAEATNARTVTGTGRNRPEVAKGTAIHTKYKPLIGAAANEMFALFLIRIAREIPGCILAQFSTLKHVLGSNFKAFREAFRARLEKAFVVPANTFDNVSGHFPIGFFVWRTGSKQPKWEAVADVFDADENRIGEKALSPVGKTISDWLEPFKHPSGPCIGYERIQGMDFQNSKFTNMVNAPSECHATFLPVTAENLVPACIHFAVRLCIAADWLNDRDQFLWPQDSWREDREFQTDCLVYTLFHGQNRISCKEGVNHWIPFAEEEVGAADAYRSRFMVEFLEGKNAGGPPALGQGDLFSEKQAGCGAPELTPEARAVMAAGRELWRYYHAQPGALPDASYYDIRAHFQGFKPNGHMNPDSPDPAYTALLASLRTAMRALAATLAPKVREHGFLR